MTSVSSLRGARVLVTGAHGFIGYHVCALLSAAGATFSVLDARTRAAVNADLVRDLPGLDREVVGEAERAGPWRDLEDYPADLVLHLAAESHVDASIEAPVRTVEANAVGTARAADAALRRRAVLLYCSTDEVYGDATGEPWEETGAPEETPLRPSSPYSAGKAAGEHVVTSYARTYGLCAAITRGSNAFGPRQLGEKLVPIVCRTLLRGGAVPLHDGGVQIRQWVHVEEFAEALLLAAAARVGNATAGVLLPGREVPVYNIAGPERLSVRDLVSAFGGRLPGAPPGESAGMRPGQDMSYSVSGSRMRSDLGYLPRRRISDPVEIDALLRHYGTG